MADMKDKLGDMVELDDNDLEMVAGGTSGAGAQSRLSASEGNDRIRRVGNDRIKVVGNDRIAKVK